MHFMIQTFKIIIFAILFSIIITKQNENTTSKNNTHTMKESDDDEYIDIKNKELDNDIKKNKFDEFKDYVAKHIKIFTVLILCLISIGVCTLGIVIMNCWVNNRQCIRRNYVIVRDCCRRGFRDDINSDQSSYHPEHSCEDFCRWRLIPDYFNCCKSNPNLDHQPERAERAECAQRDERAEVHAEVVAEPSVIYDEDNVSIQEHHANFCRSNPNPDHQSECAERVKFAERAQRVVRAQVHAEAKPSIIYDRSNVSIQEHHANFCRSNPNTDHQSERAECLESAERAQRIERTEVHVEAGLSVIYDGNNVSIQE